MNRALLSTLFVFLVAAGSARAQAPLICGDCNGDGRVSILDALVAAQHGVAILTIVSPYFELCDIEADFGDGDVDVLDSLRLAQLDVGLVPTAFCTQASAPLQILSVAAPQCVGAGSTIAVSFFVQNTNPDAANVSGVSLSFTDPALVDVASQYAVAPSPGNPAVIPASSAVTMDFLVTAAVGLSAGPITVDASITGTDSVTGAPVGDTGADVVSSWVIAALMTDFESGAAGWVGTQDWQFGTATGLPPKAGPQLWGTVLAGPYTRRGSAGNPGGRSTLTSPAIDLTMSTAPVMQFTMYRDFEGPNWDGGNVKASTDGGATFGVTLAPVSPPYNGTIANGFNNPLAGQTAWLGGPFGYEIVTMDASVLAGTNARVRFDFGADVFPTGDLGWYIDDVSVCDTTGLPPGQVTNPRPADGAVDQVAFPAGTTLRWDAAPLAMTYDVFFDTVNPPLVQIAASLPQTDFVSLGLLPSTNYFWRVDARNAVGTTPGPVWTFATGTQTMTPPILINEIATGTPDYLEIVNAGPTIADLGGWTVEIHGDSALNGTFVIPAGTMLDPGGYLIIADAAVPPGFRFTTAFNIAWNDVIPGEVVLRDASGAGVDYEAHNTATFPNLPADLNYSGPTLDLTGQGNASRSSFADTDFTGDFAATGAASPRDRNPAQPFTLPSPRPFAPTPPDGAVDVFPGVTGTSLGWDLNGDFQNFDVFLDTVNPPVMQVATGLTAPTFRTAALATSTVYYWRVEAVNAVGRTVGPVQSFTTGPTSATPGVIINEVGTGTPDFIEIYNTTLGTLDISGWQLSNYSSITGGPDGTFTFPAGTMIPSSGFLVVQDGGGAPPPGRFIAGFNLNWNAQSHGEVLLRTNTGLGSDYVAFNPGAIQILPPDQVWTAAVPLDIDPQGVAARVNFIDTDDVSDWEATAMQTPDVENPSQPTMSPPGAPNTPQPTLAAAGVVVRTAGHRLSWVAGSGSTDSYEVFFDTVNPPLASVGTSMTPTIVSSPLAIGTVYYWQVVATNSFGSTMGPVWSFTTSGIVVDPTIVINELGCGATDYVEILNFGGSAIDLSGWTVEFYNNGALNGQILLPMGTVAAPGSLTVVADAALGGAIVTGFAVGWSTTNGTSECVIRSASAVPVDYAWCYAGATGNPTRRPPSSVFFRDVNPIVSGANPASGRNVQADNDRASDWTQGAETPGTLNPGQ